MASDDFDVVVIGAGSGGTFAARRLVEAGRRVAIVAAGFVGGHCPYEACMPSKSSPRSARSRRGARSAVEHGGVSVRLELDDDRLAWRRALERRDATANGRNDEPAADELARHGVVVERGFGVIDGPGRVIVSGRLLSARDIIVNTGSVPVWPDVAGLDDVPTWTSEEALSSPELPSRLIILGAGPIGCELSQVYAAYGSDVTVVDNAERPVPDEDPAIGQAMRQVLERSGITFAFGAEPTSVRPDGHGLTLAMADGRSIGGDRLLIVVGRRPATDGLGLDTVGAALGSHGEIPVDPRCRAADRLWAIGDVTGVAPYTHTANHQARIVVDEILGRPGHDMTPDALPRAVFTDPPLAAVGLTEVEARRRGIRIVTTDVDLAEVSRAGAEGDGPLGPKDASGGILRLVADSARGVLVGAAAVGPDADSWIGESTVAIRAAVPLRMMADVVRAFPTYGEAYGLGYERLIAELDNDPAS